MNTKLGTARTCAINTASNSSKLSIRVNLEETADYEPGMMLKLDRNFFESNVNDANFTNNPISRQFVTVQRNVSPLFYTITSISVNPSITGNNATV